MTPTTKLPLKTAPTTSTTFNFSLLQKLSIRQNPVSVDITNSIKQLDSAFDNNSKKTNIIITIFNIK